MQVSVEVTLEVVYEFEDGMDKSEAISLAETKANDQFCGVVDAIGAILEE